MAIKPNGKRLLCRLIPKPNQTSSGIVTVETADDSPKMLDVTAVGPEVTRVKPGDTILAGRFTGVEFNGAQLLTEEEVLCILDGDDASRWRVTVYPYGGEGAPLASLYDLPTALRHVGPDAAYLITPGSVDDAARKAILAHEFVTVRACSPGGRRRMVIAKVPARGLFKVDGQFTARGVKDDAGHFGSIVERIAGVGECAE